MYIEPKITQYITYIFCHWGVFCIWCCFRESQVNKTVRKIQEGVCYYEATLRQFIVDDKGTVAIVVFGLPPIFHEV